MEQNLNPKVTFELSLNEVNLINRGLGKLPMEESLDIFMKIRDQVVKQLQPPAAEEVKAE